MILNLQAIHYQHSLVFLQQRMESLISFKIQKVELYQIPIYYLVITRYILTHLLLDKVLWLNKTSQWIFKKTLTKDLLFKMKMLTYQLWQLVWSKTWMMYHIQFILYLRMLLKLLQLPILTGLMSLRMVNMKYFLEMVELEESWLISL